RAIGPWETWTVTKVSDNRIALQSEQGRFLCAEGAGGAEVHANRRALGPWEQFTLTDVLTSGTATALRTNDDRHYLGVTGETVDARSTTPVLFDVTILEGDKPTALHIEGLDFIDEHGAPWKMAGNTLYVLFRQYLEGQDIEPFLKENEDLGVNCLAVGASQSGALGRLVPSEHPDFDAKVQAFTDLVGERGF